MDIPKPTPPKKKAPLPETVALSEEIRALTKDFAEEQAAASLFKEEGILLETTPTVVSPSVKPVVKKPFVPQPHLSQHPFRDNEALQDLRRKLEPPPASHRKAPRRNTPIKTQEK